MEITLPARQTIEGTSVYLGVGSNIEPEKNVLLALELIVAGEDLRPVGCSTFYWTFPTIRKDQPRFLNGVFWVDTSLSPRDLKYGFLRPLEKKLGRRRGADRHAKRTIDLDICLYGEKIIEGDGITVPDPDLYLRPFLARPVMELSPGLVLPCGETIESVAAPMDFSEMDPNLRLTEKLRRMLNNEFEKN